MVWNSNKQCLPVADAYTTRAFGSWFCSSSTQMPVFVGLPAPDGIKCFALWHSSNTMHPSKSGPHQSTSCLSRVFNLAPPAADPLMSDEYVLNTTPLFTRPFCCELIFAYLNWKQAIWAVRSDNFWLKLVYFEFFIWAKNLSIYLIQMMDVDVRSANVL